MEKLKTLQSPKWRSIEKQAEEIYNLLENNKEKVVRIKGKIHLVNKAILETNGYHVFQYNHDYFTSEPYFDISIDKPSL